MKNKYDNAWEVEGEMIEEEPYISYDIASYPADYTLSVIHEMFTNGDIVIPDFQRQFVWTINQSSLLIESFLLGLPVPQLFFYVDDDEKKLVIDGQQRIMSVIYFVNGYFGEETTHGKKAVFRLKNLDKRSPYYNKNFQDLNAKDKRKLENAVLRAMIVKQLSPKDDLTSVYHIFERLNTGGTALKAQEIRNCVFRGDFVNILKELNNDKSWRKIIGKPNLDKHQRDVELVLRLFSLATSHQTYEKPMKEFMNISMKINQDGNTKNVARFCELFTKVTKIIDDELGAKPFHLRGPINTAALDSVYTVLINNYSRLKGGLSSKFKSLIGDEKYSEATTYSTSDESAVKLRIQIAAKYLLN